MFASDFFQIDKDFQEVRTSQQFMFLPVNVPVFCEETSSLFISYPFSIFLFHDIHTAVFFHSKKVLYGSFILQIFISSTT